MTVSRLPAQDKCYSPPRDSLRVPISPLLVGKYDVGGEFDLSSPRRVKLGKSTDEWALMVNPLDVATSDKLLNEFEGMVGFDLNCLTHKRCRRLAGGAHLREIAVNPGEKVFKDTTVPALITVDRARIAWVGWQRPQGPLALSSGLSFASQGQSHEGLVECLGANLWECGFPEEPCLGRDMFLPPQEVA